MSTDTVRNGMLVTVAFKLQLRDGREANLPGNRSPMQFRIGYGQVLPALEAGILGMALNDTRQIVLSPDQGFGKRSEPQTRTIPRSELPPNLSLFSGKRLRMRRKDGQTRIVYVTAVEDDHVVVDLNHPLAGEELNFTVKVLSMTMGDVDAPA